MLSEILEDLKMISNKYQFLSKVPDEPKADGLIPGAVDGLTGKQTNTLIYQVARRKVTWKDDDLVLAATTTWDQNIL